MRIYLLQRALAGFVTLIGVTILIFLAMRVLPGDPLAMMTAESGVTYTLSGEELQAARAALGLDRPYYEQYLSWIADVARGDLGKSFWREEPINDLIVRRGPITLQIALLAVVLSWVIGVPVGVLSAVRRNTTPDYVSRVLVIFFVAVPPFWMGLLVVLGGVLIFNWRPSLTVVQFWEDPSTNLQMILGPAAVLGVGLAALTARMTRSATLEILHDDFVRTARAKGLLERIVVGRHVLRNALLPVVTVSGLALGGLIGGSVSVERAFGVPGLGTALVMAFAQRDWMVIQNLVLLYGIVFTFVNLSIDVTYALLDPRVAFR
ncbi:MAG: ABC transporter permease [Chloroflexi bacterium]|nr:ABC transporter permease [Chloroflexota bacterium]